jgi:hypothetical protein
VHPGETIILPEIRSENQVQIQYLAEAIQADGVNAKGEPAVQDAWGLEAAQTVGAVSKTGG